MNQVTCSLCNIKIEEIQWKEHLVSTKHLEPCKNAKKKNAIIFFEMMYDACPKKNEIYNLKTENTHDFWQLDFSTKLPKEKFNTLCGDSNVKSELQTGVSSDFQNFIQNVTPDVGETYFNLLDKIMFCMICSIEVNKSLIFDHITSKEHRYFDEYFIMKCMT